MPAAPVSVDVRRQVAPEHAMHAQAWAQTGTNLAGRFDGLLGSGWIRERADGDIWHTLYPFDSAESLGRWERSRKRDAWLAPGANFAREVHRELRTGIQGWFDEPPARAAGERSAGGRRGRAEGGPARRRPDRLGTAGLESVTSALPRIASWRARVATRPGPRARRPACPPRARRGGGVHERELRRGLDGEGVALPPHREQTHRG